MKRSSTNPPFIKSSEPKNMKRLFWNLATPPVQKPTHTAPVRSSLKADGVQSAGNPGSREKLRIELVDRCQRASPFSPFPKLDIQMSPLESSKTRKMRLPASPSRVV